MDRLPPAGGPQNMKTKPEPQKSNAHKTRRQVVECRFGQESSFAVRFGKHSQKLQLSPPNPASKNGLSVFHRF
jgi:hypothetical protein